MRAVSVEQFRQNLAYFLDLARGGEAFFVTRNGQVEALVRPARRGERLPRIGSAAFRGRAFELVRGAALRPHLVTWYAQPAAAVVPAPADLVLAQELE